MSFKHTNQGFCPLCTEKLLWVHTYLRDWFAWAKSMHPELHICWGFRDQASQDAAFANGTSKKQWPESKHNFLDNGAPCSLALDVFQLIGDRASFNKDFYNQLATETRMSGYAIVWGGTWKSFPDYDHFELEAQP